MQSLDYCLCMLHLVTIYFKFVTVQYCTTNTVDTGEKHSKNLLFWDNPS